LAFHLKQPLQYIQQTTTATEFSEWLVFLDMQETELFAKQDFYLAQIAAEVRRSWVSKESRQSVKTEDFVIKFQTKTPRKKKAQETDSRYSMQVSKAAWLAAVGLGKKKR
jgi:hypothetical protein